MNPNPNPNPNPSPNPSPRRSPSHNVPSSLGSLPSCTKKRRSIPCAHALTPLAQPLGTWLGHGLYLPWISPILLPLAQPLGTWLGLGLGLGLGLVLGLGLGLGLGC